LGLIIEPLAAGNRSRIPTAISCGLARDSACRWTPSCRTDCGTAPAHIGGSTHRRTVALACATVANVRCTKHKQRCVGISSEARRSNCPT